MGWGCLFGEMRWTGEESDESFFLDFVSRAGKGEMGDEMGRWGVKAVESEMI